MPLKIRNKLLVAFLSLIIVILPVAGIVGYYNQQSSDEAVRKVQTISEEVIATANLAHALEHSIMPANDYLITGDRRYADEFKKVSAEMEARLSETKKLLDRLHVLNIPKVEDERSWLKEIETAWQNIKEISLKIFEIPDPIGNRNGAELMEEMDYRWAGHATDLIHKWHEADTEEYGEAIGAAERAKSLSWSIMSASGVLLLIVGVIFAVFYSSLFVKPIKTIHLRANSIARGNFKGALDIRTGDELEQLANSINEMAEKLDGFYSTLEEKVRERTRELRASEAKFKTLAEQSPTMIFIHKRGSVVYANARCEELMKYKLKEFYSSDFNFLSLIAPESVEWIRSKFDKHQRGEEVEPYDFTIVSKDGKKIEVMINSVLIDYEGEKAILGIMTDITERKKAEKDIKESEERFRTIFDNAIDGILLADVENKRLYTGNKSIGAMLGYTLEEIKSLGVADIHPGKDLPYVITQFERQARGEFTMAEDIPVKRKDGSVFYAEINSIPISLAGKQYLMGIFRDISERKKMVESLKIEKDKLIKIFEAMEDGVYIVNQNYDIEYINPILEREYGPWKGIKCYTYFHDRTEVCPWCPNERVWAGETVRWEWFSFKNRKIYDLLDTPMRNPDGSVWKLEIFRDITARKKAEETLRYEKGRAQTYLNIAGVIFVVIDSNEKVSLVNKKGAEVLGYPEGEIIGKNWFDEFLPARVRDEVRGVFRKLIRGEDDSVEYVENPENPVLTCSGEERFIAWHNTVLKDETGKIVATLSSGEDITERKKAEAALKESETRLKGLVESVTDYIFTVDVKDGQPMKTTHGPGCVAITGYTFEEYEANPNLCFQMVYEGDRDAVVSQAKAALSGKAESIEHRIICKDGRIKWVRNVTVPRYDEDGRLISYDGLISDITERKKAEDALKQRLNELEQFRKVTIKRELRMEELQRKVDELEKELKKR